MQQLWPVKGKKEEEEKKRRRTRKGKVVRRHGISQSNVSVPTLEQFPRRPSGRRLRHANIVRRGVPESYPGLPYFM